MAGLHSSVLWAKSSFPMWCKARRVFSMAFVTDIAWKFPPWWIMPVLLSIRGLSVAVFIDVYVREFGVRKMEWKLTWITFLRDSDMCGKDIFDLWTKELRSRAQRITVLPQQVSIFLKGNLLFMKLGQLATLQKIPDILGAFHLSSSANEKSSGQINK